MSRRLSFLTAGLGLGMLAFHVLAGPRARHRRDREPVHGGLPMMCRAHLELVDMWIAAGEIPDDRGTRQFATTILTELLDERLQWRHIVDELTSSTLPQASPDPGGSAAPPGSSP
ncbi:MAG TPA: hypothetical protein PLB92_06160 [Rhodoglobus sp.]|nr:hypothetical protein [Rhodoglobus sp.]